MARTQGASTYREESSSQGETRRRLMTSFQRRHGEVKIDTHVEDHPLEEHLFRNKNIRMLLKYKRKLVDL